MAAAATPDAQAWDRAAAGWHHHTALIRAWLAEANEAMLDAAGIGPGLRVLDVAAGSGDQTVDVARRVGPAGHVLATDVSPAMIALAQAEAHRAGLAQVSARVANAQALGLDGAGFDAAVCRLGLMFCTRPLDALAGILRALSPGARFAALVFSGAEANPCIAITSRVARLHAGLPMDAPPPPGSLLGLGAPGLMARLLADAGFRDVTVRPIAAPFRVPSAADYLEFVRGAGSPILEILRPLPDEARRRAWDDIGRELSRFATPSGWEGPNELLLCVGTRP